MCRSIAVVCCAASSWAAYFGTWQMICSSLWSTAQCYCDSFVRIKCLLLLLMHRKASPADYACFANACLFWFFDMSFGSAGTSMISLIIPPKDQISRVNKMLSKLPIAATCLVMRACFVFFEKRRVKPFVATTAWPLNVGFCCIVGDEMGTASNIKSRVNRQSGKYCHFFFVCPLWAGCSCLQTIGKAIVHIMQWTTALVLKCCSLINLVSLFEHSFGRNYVCTTTTEII